jgi:hypothetical protein
MTVMTGPAATVRSRPPLRRETERGSRSSVVSACQGLGCSTGRSAHSASPSRCVLSRGWRTAFARADPARTRTQNLRYWVYGGDMTGRITRLDDPTG